MAVTITAAYVQTFERNVRFLAQQKGSKLRQHCQLKSESSKSHNWDRVGQLTAVTKSTRAQATPVNDTPFTRRASSQATWNVGDLVEQEEIVQMLIDPTSAIVTAMGYALGRAIDKMIIVAATAAVSDGAGGTTVFPDATQTLDQTGTAISVDGVSNVTQIFMTNNIDADVPKVMVIGPVQVRQIAQLEKATSEFYVNAKALAQDGFVRNWMGYSWIYSNLLVSPDAGANLNCLAFSEMALGLHTTKDVWTRVQEDPAASFAWRIYGAFTAGAVRIEDEHIVQWKLKNT